MRRCVLDYYKGPLKAFVIIPVIAVVGQLLLGQFSTIRTISAFGVTLIGTLILGGLIQIIALIYKRKSRAIQKEIQDL